MRHTVGIDDAHGDIHAVAHALGDDAKLFELGDHPVEVLEIGGLVGQMDDDLGARDPPASLGVAFLAGDDLGADRAGVVPEFAQREQQAGAQAIDDAGQQDRGGIRPGACAQRRGFIGMQGLQVGAFEIDLERIGAFLLQQDADVWGVGHGVLSFAALRFNRT